MDCEVKPLIDYPPTESNPTLTLDETDFKYGVLARRHDVASMTPNQFM